MEQRVLTRLRKDFQVGSEDWNGVAFTGQRIRWTQDSPKTGRTLKLVKKRLLSSWRRSLGNEIRRNAFSALFQCMQCSEILLGQVNWLQSRLHFPCCYTFSRCASMAASPSVGDVKSPNKLARKIQSQPVKLHYWPLTGPLRTLGFLDASHRNKVMTVFLA